VTGEVVGGKEKVIGNREKEEREFSFRERRIVIELGLAVGLGLALAIAVEACVIKSLLCMYLKME